MREILKEADPDAATFRNRWNAAITRKDSNALRRLVFGSEAHDQPAVTVALLGEQLTEIDAADAVKFLKEANERHPADFWILFKLAYACQVSNPPLNADAAALLYGGAGIAP